MKLIDTLTADNGKTYYKFETGNGCTFTRTRLTNANESMEIRNWAESRSLFIIDESSKEYFPLATHRIEMTGNRAQSDPLFVTLPCRIKPKTKSVLQIFEDDNIVTEVRIKNHFNWNL